jgi:hypothetical protein
MRLVLTRRESAREVILFGALVKPLASVASLMGASWNSLLKWLNSLRHLRLSIEHLRPAPELGLVLGNDDY